VPCARHYEIIQRLDLLRTRAAHPCSDRQHDDGAEEREKVADNFVSFGSSLHVFRAFLGGASLKGTREFGVRSMFWGAGVEEKGARQGSLGVIAQVAATAAPPLVTAEVPPELWIDPCEKKKNREPGPAAPWSIGNRSRGRGSRWHKPFLLLLRENRDEVLKKDWLRVGDAP